MDREGADLGREQPESTLDRPLQCRINSSSVGFQTPSPPKEPLGIRSGRSEKLSTKTAMLGSPPNHPKSTGPENIGPERANFGRIGAGAVGSLAGITLKNNEKFRLHCATENGLCWEVGGGTGTGIE